jgi:hypothetical protein
VYRWELDGPTQQEFASLPAAARASMAAFMDARTPKHAPAVAHELAAALDQRARALGDQLAASPEPWLASQLGVLAPHASPLLREDYARRAGAAATYREAPGSPIPARPWPPNRTTATQNSTTCAKPRSEP